MSDFVKFGIVGVGSVWRYHKLGSKNNPKIKFTAAYDVNSDNLTRAAKYSKFETFTNLDRFLKSDIDAVLVLVPHYLHKDIVVSAAEAGKHVLCEKPMAPTLEECDDMIKASRKAGVKFMIAENHRFLPAHQLIKDMLSKNFIGDVFLGRTYEGAYCSPNEFLDSSWWHFCYDKGGGGVVADQGVHKFTMLNWFLGEVHSAQCWLSKTLNSPSNKGEDTAIVLLRYKCGAIVTVDISSTTVHTLTNRTELHGTKGSILEDHSWQDPIRVFSSHPEAEVKGEFYSPKVEHGPYPDYYKISMGKEDAYFADCILDNKQPEFTPEDAKKGVAVVLLSYLSAKKRVTVRMEELMKVYKSEGTETILEGLEDVVQRNYKSISWE
ncbi:MAG: Gfo/Idh/MocA family protein [Candidatus Heimdallarchaeota archaeon]